VRLDDRQGADYKGRYFLVIEPVGGPLGESHALHDVRWNSERTAARTLASMSSVELRRRLRSALGRAARPRAG
jgi:hypothetical protein